MQSLENRPFPRPSDYHGFRGDGASVVPRTAPGADGDKGDRAGRPAAAEASSERSTDQDPVRVLVVDDQPDVLATTVELFKLMGYEVLSASNGIDALVILKSTPDIQVLFSDVVMPGMNGFTLGKEARRLIPGINVILASGFQGEAIAASGTEAGDFHFLVKPYRMAEVARMLRK